MKWFGDLVKIAYSIIASYTVNTQGIIIVVYCQDCYNNKLL